MDESKFWMRKIVFFSWKIGFDNGLILKNIPKCCFSANLTGNL